MKCFPKAYSNKLSVDDVFYLQTDYYSDGQERLLSNKGGPLTDGIENGLA